MLDVLHPIGIRPCFIFSVPQPHRTEEETSYINWTQRSEDFGLELAFANYYQLNKTSESVSSKWNYSLIASNNLPQLYNVWFVFVLFFMSWIEWIWTLWKEQASMVQPNSFKNLRLIVILKCLRRKKQLWMHGIHIYEFTVIRNWFREWYFQPKKVNWNISEKD